MDKILKKAIDFINEWGISDGNYIAKNIKNFMNGYNDADDNFCELADEHHEQLQIVIKGGLNIDQLINLGKEKCAEDIQQAVRYYFKYQNYPMWEDQNEYQKGVQVTCENIEELIENDFINNKE